MPVSIAATAVAHVRGVLDFLVIKRGVPNRRHLAQAIYRALVGIPVPTVKMLVLGLLLEVP